MKFEPNEEELAKRIEHYGPSDLNSPKLMVPGSDWNSQQLVAFRASLLDDLPLDRLFPSEYMPEDHPVSNTLLPKIREPSEDDLKEFLSKRGDYIGNPFGTFFIRLQSAITTGVAYIPGTTGHARNPSSTSDLSSSSNEDKDEEPSKQMLSILLDTILFYPQMSDVRYGNQKYLLAVETQQRSMEISFGSGSKVTAKNDGGLYLTYKDLYTGSVKHGIVPLISFEAKRRHAHHHRAAGEEEKYSEALLGQELAELLGHAMANVNELVQPTDQEALLLTIHGTHLKLVVARFTTAYLTYVKSHSIPESERLWIRRSSPFQLKDREGREGALRMIIGILEYIKSGTSEIGLMQAAFSYSGQ
ncbi:hypothetical protein FGG08_007185 [Glutinoglossum americanum]|uniref:Uncharacterized protein n=1 Tax=Glutinoglossum americanum TaxID=1670608 RepID=A0A9P8I011_9PEZI|nr:hypothetical protein FGG08_007185 [Glutinoglossum americanum]